MRLDSILSSGFGHGETQTLEQVEESTVYAHIQIRCSL